MIQRKGRLIRVALVLFASIALVSIFLSRRAQPDLQLVFVGYTNVPIEVTWDGNKVVLWTSKAVMEVTNCGSASLRISHRSMAHPLESISDHTAYVMASMPIIGSNRVAVGFVDFPQTESRWQAKIAYSRLDWMEHLIDQGRNSRYKVLRSVARTFSPSPKLRWVQSDWITNSAARCYHITAPPREVPVEAFKDVKRP